MGIPSFVETSIEHCTLFFAIVGSDQVSVLPSLLKAADTAILFTHGEQVGAFVYGAFWEGDTCTG